MKQNKMITLAVIVTFGISALTGCGSKTENPGEPPAEVIRGESTDLGTDSVQAGNGVDIVELDNGNVYEGEILSDAISVRIGRESRTEWNIDLYNNDAALTMLDYLSGSALLFPTYTYDGDGGFVAQGVRGNYTDDDQQTIADVKCGELYLFSGGQLRFYFKDIEGANITATPIGYYTDTEGLADAVQEAYTSNLDDTWGVSVYFWITKTLK
ncbi:MAG: hypothetical protein K2N89_14180 [Lachnospiraceae bacterium]|nr:hypothetical protein [Lachnospiraceae bacterium]